MALRIFSVKDKATNKITRLFKAETKGQVSKHLANSVEIEIMGVVELAELMGQEGLKVEDASVTTGDDGSTADAPAAASDTSDNT